MTSTPILVLGATGKTGRRVAARLTAAGHTVRAGSRTGNPPFDWADRSTWAAALDGVGAVYVAYVPEIGLPGSDDDIGAFANEAGHAGVSRLVLLSGRVRRSPAERGPRAGCSRRAPIGRSCVAHVFAQNFTEGAFADSSLARGAG